MAFGISTGLSIASRTLGVIGQINANYTNAASLESEAKYTLYKSRLDEDKMRREGKQFIGDQAVAFAGGGIALDSASAERIMEQTQFEIEVDASTIRESAQIQARQLRKQASGLRDSAMYAVLGGALGVGADIAGSMAG